LLVSTEIVKQLREKTGAGVMDCKKALQEAEGDVEKAMECLIQQGLALACKKATRVAKQGIIDSYIHSGGKIGAIVEVNCETDFVARTEEFKELAHNLALQIAAMSARYTSPEELPPDSDLDSKEACLLLQPFIKDPSKTIQDIITETVARLGENIKVGRFSRFELGC